MSGRGSGLKIIGVHNTGILSSAALVVDGRLVSGMAEERLDRRKYSKYFPHKAVAACLNLGVCEALTA